MEDYLLQIGDVFDLKKGDSINAKIPEKYAYSNKKASNKLTSFTIEVGKPYVNDINLKNDRDELIEDVVKLFNFRGGFEINPQKVVGFVLENAKNPKPDVFRFPEGEFLVIKTTFDGGGRAHNDYYPDGHHVFAKRLIDGNYDENQETVDFYQSGSFSCYIPAGRLPKDKMTFTRTFKIEDIL